MSQRELKGTNFTTEQIQAITEKGSNILVSASAGSGKTRILVERVIQKIMTGSDIDSLLIVTFTRAAAKEMKERIEKELRKEIARTTDAKMQQHLLRQLTLLPQAQISTIHAFCMQIIQRFYYIISMDPVFRLLSDTTEIELLKDRVWEEVTEELFGQEDNQTFLSLAEMYSSNRSDDNLKLLVQKLQDLAIANVDPLAWLEDLVNLYDVSGDDFYIQPIWQQLMKPQITAVLENNLQLLNNALYLGNDEPSIEKAITIVREEYTTNKRILESINENNMQEAFALVSGMKFARWPGTKKGISDEVLEVRKDMKVYRDQAKDNITKSLITEYFAFSLEDNLHMLKEMGPIIKELIHVTKRYHETYQNLKEVQQLLDFNDLEHYALNILYTPDEDGVCEAQLFYQETFQEIMIDEYQDTNVLQDNILSAVSREASSEGNRFMVGDVKQSIYRFRLADPSLFIEKYNRYENEKNGKKIILQKNFRSRAEVIDFINLLFSQLMDEEIGEVKYDGEAALVQSFADFPKAAVNDTELLLYEKHAPLGDTEDAIVASDDDFQFITDSRSGQIALVGQKILSLIDDKFLVYDKETQEERPIRYNDIVILSRKSSLNTTIQTIFKELNIPVSLSSVENYFQTTEVSIMMSLLRVIDNPQQDISLVAVLRSPIVGLDENDLARIRLDNKYTNYYTATKEFMDSRVGTPEESQIQTKLYAFFDTLNKWRQRARRLSISELIWMIYEDTGFLDYVSGMPAGKQRKANLHALYERATVFEETNFKGLFQFIQFIDRMLQRDKDLSEPTVLSKDDETVRVMTIHGSKGLEFPIVFVIDLSGQINKLDFTGDYVIDKTHGFGTRYINTEHRIKTDTYASSALANEVKRHNYSEEMRNLYVALTRAEQKLFLVGAVDTEEGAYKKWGNVGTHEELVLPPYERLNASNMLDWIGYAIYRHRDSEQDNFDVANKSVYNHQARFTLSFHDQEEIYEKLTFLMPTLAESEWFKAFIENRLVLNPSTSTNQLVKEAVERMNATYDFPAATVTTSYQSVSEIKRVLEDPDAEKLLRLDEKQPSGQNRYVIDELKRPAFITETQAPTPAEIGMATHLILQKLSFNDKPTVHEVQELIEQLVSRGILNAQVAKHINQDKLLEFFDTPFAKRISKHSRMLERETSFSLKLDAEEIFKEVSEDDDLLVHGIVDGYFEEEDGKLVLFDYKTDSIQRFGDERFEVMKEKYGGQLAVYELALENILGKEVKESYLILLDTNEVLSMH